MSNVPEGAQLSEDGNYYWDGEAWQPVQGGGADSGGGGGESGGGEGGGEVTAADLEPIGDTGTDPGDESKMTDQTKPYFVREGDPEEAGDEPDAVIDASTFAGPEGGGENG
jgi:hypothetical protein